MQASELIQEFRDHLDDDDPEDDDRLWSDTEVLSYLNEAIDEFCMETEILIDSTNALTQLVVTADNPFVPYDDRIIRFERVSHDTTTNRTLQIVSILNIQSESYANDYGINLSSSAWLNTTGDPRLLISNMATQQLRAYPIPTANTTVATTVRRLPLLQFTQPMVDAGNSPEIPQRFHRKLLTYMKLLAYSKTDGETYDDTNALKYTALWERDIREVKGRIERERGKRPRVVRYQDVGAPVYSRGAYYRGGSY